MTLQPHSSGPPGMQVTVEGLGFDGGRTEVRWNSHDGELLGTANGEDFSLTVTVPQVPEGLYTMIGLSRQPGGAIGNAASAAFLVISDSSAAGRDTASATSTTPPTSPVPSRRLPSGAAAAGLVAAGGMAGVLGTALVQRRRRRASRGP